MEEEIRPFDLTAVCRCGYCKQIEMMRVSFDKGKVTLEPPEDWHFNPQEEAYECYNCYWSKWEGEDVEPDY